MRQIREHDFARRTIHLGYYLLGALAALPFAARPGAFLEAPPDRFFNVVNCLLGGISVGLTALLAFRLSGRRWGAVLAAACAAGAYLIAFNAAFAEVYIAQSCFVLLALVFWWRGWSVAAGLSFSAAFLTTPSTLLLLPLFACTRPRGRPLLLFCLAAALPAAALLLPRAQDYLHGERGVLIAAGRGFRLKRALLKEGFEILSGFPAWLPFLAAGLGEAAARTRRALLAGLVASWAAAFFLAESTGDVPVQLPLHFLLAALAALGAGRIARGQATGRLSAFLPVVLAAAALGAAAVIQSRTHVRVAEGHFFAGAAGVAGAGTLVLLGPRRREGGTTIGGTTTGRTTISGRAIPAAVLVLLAILNGAVSLHPVRVQALAMERFRQAVLGVAADAPREGRPVLAVGGFDRGVLFEAYARGAGVSAERINLTWLYGNDPSDLARREAAVARVQRAIAAREEIWIVDSAPELEAELRRDGYTLRPENEGLVRAAADGAGIPAP